MMFETLDDSNFVIFAAKYYDNPQCTNTSEFLNDLNRFKYIKKLLTKYHSAGDLKERLILNHLIVLYNCFDQHTTKMLFVKMPEYKKYLVPFIEYLGRMPINVFYDKDQKIVQALRNM